MISLGLAGFGMRSMITCLGGGERLRPGIVIVCDGTGATCLLSYSRKYFKTKIK